MMPMFGKILKNENDKDPTKKLPILYKIKKNAPVSETRRIFEKAYLRLPITPI